MANIRDIAKRTGYSVSTVSRVINQHPYVDEAKRTEILKVIKELNYVPNANARQLSSGKTKNIGVILPYTNHPYFDQLLSGIIEVAFSEGYKVTLLPTNYQIKREQQYLEEFAAKAFDGLIITSRANPLELLLDYQRYGPIVFCEKIEDLEVTSVYIDRKQSITDGLSFLKDQGVKRVGVTLGRTGRMSYNSKITLKLCKEIFPEFNEADVYWQCIDTEHGKQAGGFFKERGIDGIFTNSDTVAAGVLQSYKNQKIPIVGRENMLISELLNFSTIDHHLKQCGETAFRLFLNDTVEQVKIPYTFIQRP
ncbi:LacI family DNA-binding transcriptional regulator [Enterococcus mundtii]|uniref:LacI family transcriptional regulator n=1 Tax=Enterococcus mundtii TaxID=53346 RepID=A0ABQ0VH16_ENTMU|nr:LacI family DNA-binding transcriptional regulator [Enterococcus mundtii]GEN18372.1 LacI family transcriptional regulator [Ligilactobacillus acidipiscis]AUB53613.1 LacI family transcriptional regulator [Enterococcus mundtii]MZZ59060.1 LacI family DNA-binding transcriptional regulator [Enterococcus mundtii]MZZ61991.1 LacI family DNA-binding transcriptional regulator [Enterococcus mundtii]MZZ68894.1 LacI family DNA-binding transcriptional regulator [Enterococcus mundtii]